MIPTPAHPYKNHRFPPEIIARAVWLYHRFSLSFREVEERLAERGITVSYETVRQWCLKFGQTFAKKLRHRRGRPGDTWHLDEMFIRMGGKRYYLWRAVDQDGETLDILVQTRPNTGAANRFFRKLLKGLRYVPNRLVTDQLRSYAAAHRTALRSVHGPINNLFRIGRHLMQAVHYRLYRDRAFTTWREVTTSLKAA